MGSSGSDADDVVYDLGSGDGRILILAAQKYGARGVGIEINPKLVEVSRQVAREAQLSDKVTFLEGDLFAAEISKATVVTLYLSNSVNRELEPKLRRELQPGALNSRSPHLPASAFALCVPADKSRYGGQAELPNSRPPVLPSSRSAKCATFHRHEHT